MKNKILNILLQVKKGYSTPEEATSELLDLFNNSNPLPMTFEQCLREEFLINTQNYPKRYHNMFNEKFNRARKYFEEQKTN